MMHGVPCASPLAGVFVRALARAPLGVRMRVCVRARVCRSKQYDRLLQQCTLKAPFEEASSEGGGGGC